MVLPGGTKSAVWPRQFCPAV